MSRTKERSYGRNKNSSENTSGRAQNDLRSKHPRKPLSTGDQDARANQSNGQYEDSSFDKARSRKQASHTSPALPGSLGSSVLRKSLNLVKDKASAMIESGKEQLGNRYASLSDEVKLRSREVDGKVKANPYAFALGALGAGFILGRLVSGKGRHDLTFARSAASKAKEKVANVDIASIASAVGISVGGKEVPASSSDESSKATGGYNERQARKIG